MLTAIGSATSRETRTPSVDAERPRADAAPDLRTERPSFQDALRTLGREIDRGERLVARAARGGSSGLDAGQLIALQAGIYRYTEAVDLAAKLVDRAGAAVRTTLQGSGG